jgi:hypothetical protein
LAWSRYDLSRSGGVGWTWCVPPTVIPYLILDYGLDGMPIALGIMLAALQWIASRWAGRGLLGHVAALLAFKASFLTIQILGLFNSSTVLPLAGAGVLSLLLRARASGASNPTADSPRPGGPPPASIIT